MSGAVAAGHPLTAQSAAEVLTAGGNAVDAAVAAMATSFVAEPLLTGFGAGGYMLVCQPDGTASMLDFSVAAPDSSSEHAQLKPIEVSFGEASQVFNVGAASCAVYGTAAGMELAVKRFGTLPLADLVADAAEHAREGVVLNQQQAYVVEILHEIVTDTPECAEIFAPGGRLLQAGERILNPQLAESLLRFGQDGSAPFYTGDIAGVVLECLQQSGGLVKANDLSEYQALEREPLEVAYRNCHFLTNPPPSAGGVLIAYALHLLDEYRVNKPSLDHLVRSIELAQDERTSEFLAGLIDPEFVKHFKDSKLGGTTHISVLDGDGMACSVTCSNGEGCGIVVPGTGIHLNNMMGEEDLNPLGFFKHEPGRRLPSMMSPSVLTREGCPWIVLGSAGSNRIRSAILQSVVNVVDHQLSLADALNAPRLHLESGTIFAEPGIDRKRLLSIAAERGLKTSFFKRKNLFFGGVQAVSNNPVTGFKQAAGDRRRGGVGITL